MALRTWFLCAVINVFGAKVRNILITRFTQNLHIIHSV